MNTPFKLIDDTYEEVESSGIRVLKSLKILSKFVANKCFMTQKSLIFFTLFLLFSCNCKKEHLLVAGSVKDGSVLGGTFHFTLERNNTFTFSYIPNDSSYLDSQIIKGNFYIKRDTIYFTKNSRFRKAVIKNDEFELVGNYFKLKIIENNTTIRPPKNTVEFIDFTFFSNVKHGVFGFDEGENADINQRELTQLKSLIQQKMESEKKLFKWHSKQSDYFKQCICITNKKNEKIVWVNCISKDDKYLANRWQYEMLQADDGGESFFQLTVNLSKAFVIDFQVNGHA